MNTNVHHLIELSKLQHQRLLDESATQRLLGEITPRKTKKSWLTLSWLTRQQPTVTPQRIVQVRG